VEGGTEQRHGNQGDSDDLRESDQEIAFHAMTLGLDCPVDKVCDGGNATQSGSHPLRGRSQGFLDSAG
jgi:hypothetical protein